MPLGRLQSEAIDDWDEPTVDEGEDHDDTHVIDEWEMEFGRDARTPVAANQTSGELYAQALAKLRSA